jgi:hypothetical protein
VETSVERCPTCGTELSRVKFREIQAKLREEEQSKAAELAQSERVMRQRIEQQFKQDMEKQKQAAEKKAKEEAEKEIKKLAAERDQAAKKLKDAQGREAELVKQVKEQAEKQRQKELAQQRQALESDSKLALIKQQANFNRDRESYQRQVQQLEKKLQKKTANELGDGAEIDLLESLRECFQDDRITRVPKGQAGADIVHEILYKGEPCGKIVIDSKNHQRWLGEFVTKLRQDQMDAKAEHAILATTAFPVGKKEISIESEVIVVAPARVVCIVQILRNALIAMKIRGLSLKERSTKMARLYELITSEPYSQKFTEAGRLTEEILELDVKEQREHAVVWKKRGTLAKRVQNALRDVETEVAAVIEGSEEEEAPTAFPVKSVPSTAAADSDERILWNKR